MSKPTLAPKTQTAGFMIFSSIMLLVLSAIVLGLFMNRLEIRQEEQSTPTRRIQDLVTLLKQAETKRVSLEAETASLHKKLLQIQHHGEGPVTFQDPEVQKLYQMAGFTPITGDGIVITLYDNKKTGQSKDSHADPNAGKLQADDLLKLVNELKSAGATAISINDLRLIATSEIITAGSSITVNQTGLSQPVEVKALGKPDVLLGALKIRGGILEYLDFFGIQVTVKKQANLKVPAYKGALPF